MSSYSVCRSAFSRSPACRPGGKLESTGKLHLVVNWNSLCLLSLPVRHRILASYSKPRNSANLPVCHTPIRSGNGKHRQTEPIALMSHSPAFRRKSIPGAKSACERWRLDAYFSHPPRLSPFFMRFQEGSPASPVVESPALESRTAAERRSERFTTALKFELSHLSESSQVTDFASRKKRQNRYLSQTEVHSGYMGYEFVSNCCGFRRPAGVV